MKDTLRNIGGRVAIASSSYKHKAAKRLLNGALDMTKRSRVIMVQLLIGLELAFGICHGFLARGVMDEPGV